MFAKFCSVVVFFLERVCRTSKQGFGYHVGDPARIQTIDRVVPVRTHPG